MMWSVYVASIWQQEWYILRHIIYNLALACTCSGPCIVKYKDLAARPGLQTSRRWSKISEFLLGYTADFSTTIYICLKLRLLCTFHHKTTSKHPRIQEFDSILQKNLWLQIKTGKAPQPSWLLLCLGRPKLPDFFETQCWQSKEDKLIR